MADPYNALYGPPQAPMNNALMQRDPQSMSLNDMLRAAESLTMQPLPKGERPADPLRWAADYIGTNPDSAISIRNMLHSALNTSANWLDGTRDPSAVKVGPDTLAPLGIGSMGTGLANALTRGAPARMTDSQIAESLAKQYPGEIGIGKMHRGRMAGHPRVWVSGEDGMTNASVGRLRPAGEVGAGTMPTRDRVRFAANDIFTDNARSSAPGLAANSTQEGEFTGLRSRGYLDERPQPSYMTFPVPDTSEEENAMVRVPSVGELRALGERLAAQPPHPNSIPLRRPKTNEEYQKIRPLVVEGLKQNADLLKGEVFEGTPVENLVVRRHLSWQSPDDWRKLANSFLRAEDRRGDFIIGSMFPNYEPGQRESTNVEDRRFDDWRYSSNEQQHSSPSNTSLAANSTQPQQDDQGVMSILRRYGLAD